MTRPCRCFNYSCGRCVPELFCAHCTQEIKGEPHREPFGRAGEFVNICDRCATEHPRSGRYAYGDNKGASAGMTGRFVSQTTTYKKGGAL